MTSNRSKGMLETPRIVNKTDESNETGSGATGSQINHQSGKMFQQQGAALQSYNNELIKCIDELCAKRDDLQKQIKDEDEEKNKIQNDIQILTEKLAKINESLAKKIATRNDYDKTISETEAAYVKIIDSSHTLLNTLHKEASVLKDKGVPGFSNVQTS